MSSSSDSSSSVSVGDDAVTATGTLEPKEVTTSRPDTCTWYAEEHCNKPRTCHDCLNVAIQSLTQCAIDPYGACVSMDEYDKFIANTNNTNLSDANGSTYFPSDSYTYCSSGDRTCSACKAVWIAQYTSNESTSSPHYCIGDGGCICIDACELPDFTTTVITNECSGFETKSVLFKVVTLLGLSAGAVVLFYLISIGVRALVNKIDTGAHASLLNSRRQPRREPRVVLLTLTGWKSLQESLMTSDSQQVLRFASEQPPSIAHERTIAVPIDEEN